MDTVPHTRRYDQTHQHSLRDACGTMRHLLARRSTRNEGGREEARHLDVGMDHTHGVQRRNCRQHVAHQLHRVRLRPHQSAAGGSGVPALLVHYRHLAGAARRTSVEPRHAAADVVSGLAPVPPAWTGRPAPADSITPGGSMMVECVPPQQIRIPSQQRPCFAPLFPKGGRLLTSWRRS